jgi:hypothetical protein
VLVFTMTCHLHHHLIVSDSIQLVLQAYFDAK